MNMRDKFYREMFDAWSHGEIACAFEVSRKLLCAFPDFNLGRVLQGVILYELARYDEAEQVLHDAMLGLPLEHQHHGYVHLGHLYRERGDYDRAERWYRKAIELDPENAGRHIFLGALGEKRGLVWRRGSSPQGHAMFERCRGRGTLQSWIGPSRSGTLRGRLGLFPEGA